MPWMNLHHLKYFLMIAEEGSLANASKKLLVGQPALSAQLKQFEDWLGVKLFRRENKRLVITEEGEYVLKYARAIKDLEDELIVNMGHADDILKKELVLGAQESVAKSVLAAAICKITKQRPVRLKVIEGTGAELFELLVSGKIDIFIGNFKPLNELKEIFYVSLGKEPVSIWGVKEMAGLKSKFPDSLNGQKFVVPGFQNQIRHDFERFMLQSGLSFQISVEAQDTALQKELASRGEGLVLLGDQSAKAWVKSGRLVKIGTVKGMSEEYWMGMVKKAIDNNHLKAVLEAFKS
jgi:LysR family transcriptional regulator, transcriptional activator of nhaA